MRRLFLAAVALAIVGLVAFWVLTMPRPVPSDALAGLTGDATRGQPVFWAAGCASCHSVADAKGDAQMVLAGGQSFASDFGTFHAPNISPDPVNGIGGWDLETFANAVTRGISPEGEHYFPVFPYNNYNKMTYQDLADLKAFMDTLPADATPSQPHEVGFPFNIRRLVGGWKLLFFTTKWAVPDPLTPVEARGRYLAEALAHCTECHTPRNPVGGLLRSRWLAGAPIPGTTGRTPNITPAKLTWSTKEIAEYLNSGFTPDFDSVGGHMAYVVSNFARLQQADRDAVAAYLKKVPAVQ